MKHLSWKPPWVVGVGDDGEDLAEAYLGSNTKVKDEVGLGRIPGFWWTLNCKYTSVYDIHRLNVATELGGRWVLAGRTRGGEV